MLSVNIGAAMLIGNMKEDDEKNNEKTRKSSGSRAFCCLGRFVEKLQFESVLEQN